jgi:hypothetical protein
MLTEKVKLTEEDALTLRQWKLATTVLLC